MTASIGIKAGSTMTDSERALSKNLAAGITYAKNVNDPMHANPSLTILGKGASIGASHCSHNVRTHLPTADPTDVGSGNNSSVGFKFAPPLLTVAHSSTSDIAVWATGLPRQGLSEVRRPTSLLFLEGQTNHSRL